jgi:hypothetical protein
VRLVVGDSLAVVDAAVQCEGRGRLYRINQKKLKVIQEWLDWFDRKE